MPLVLGLKNSGADAVYLPMAASTNVAVAQGLQQSGVDMKATLIASGYGQEFLDSPAAKSLPDSTIFTVGLKPVELKNDPAIKQFRADLKKYADFTGVPDFGMYTGYILADYAIKSLEGAGKTPTRQGLIDAGHAMGTYDQAGLSCTPVDVSLEGRGQDPVDELRLLRAAQGWEVRAVPEERQADRRASSSARPKRSPQPRAVWP